MVQFFFDIFGLGLKAETKTEIAQMEAAAEEGNFDEVERALHETALADEGQKIKLFERAFVIFSERAVKTMDEDEKTAMLERAMEVLLDFLRDFERADKFARRVDNIRVWRKLARTQEMWGMAVEAHASFIMAGDPGHYHEDVVQNASWNMEVGAGRGLINPRNACFINAALQCLAYCPPFAQGVLAEAGAGAADEEEEAESNVLFPLIGDTVRKILRRDGELHPTVDSFESRLLEDTNLRLIGDGHRYSNMRMDDSHGFLQHLVRALEGKRPGEMAKIFEGYLQMKIKCNSCGLRNDQFQPFMDLPLTGGGSVESSLRRFFQKENRGLRFCPKCDTPRRWSHTAKIYVPPNALVVRLSNFRHSGTGVNFEAVKRHGNVNFQETLQIPVSGPEKRASYELTGVIEHQGRGSKSGHYVAFGKTADGAWLNANDKCVRKVNFEFFSSRTEPSVLVYTRRKNPAASGPWATIRSWVTRAMGGLRDKMGACLPPGEGCGGSGGIFGGR